MKRRRARASGANPPPATNTEAPRAPAPPADDDDAALAALLASALEAQARRREADLPAELAATDLLRTCLSAALLAEGAAREALVQTARREFDRAVAPRATPRARSRAA
ncbi:MAG TPA: hypothetical protein VFS43_38620 [Polyangiaceae bacterium]|nr:hypothetical protein [Polyangiaceae bacterium]